VKIILITKKNKNLYNSRINIDFIRKIGPLCNKFNIIEAFDKKNNKLLVQPKDLYEKYKPDVIMCHSQHDLLNGFFKNLPCLKIIIAVDFWKIIEKNRFDFYENNDFDVIFYRGYIPEKYRIKLGIPTIWLPWSADTSEFYPIENFDNKIKKVGFAGTCTNTYKIRKKAIEVLYKSNLLKDHGRVLSEYPEILRKYVCMLSSAEKNSIHAKTFEIMASGSIPLINSLNENEKTLFKTDCYITYNEDMTDIVKNTRKVLFNRELAIEMSKNARNEIEEKHTDNIRIKQLYKHIESFL